MKLFGRKKATKEATQQKQITNDQEKIDRLAERVEFTGDFISKYITNNKKANN